jgi:inosine-uridine nucleoside N-ribohydrolase
MKKKPVIIDCDTGTDDVVAIIAAQGCEQINILAITTVCGNVDLQYTSRNTLNLVRAIGFDIPVAKGAASPILRDLKTIRSSD